MGIRGCISKMKKLKKELSYIKILVRVSSCLVELVGAYSKLKT